MIKPAEAIGMSSGKAIKISYILTQQDREAFNDYWRSSRHYLSEFWLWRQFLCFCYFMLVPFFEGGSPPSWKDLPTRRKLLYLGPVKLEILESAFQIYTNQASESYTWECLQAVEQTSSHIFLKLGARTCVVPRHAFDSDD
ncbi:MAG TPA: YcxB family protein [Oligoflexia bacterium]|nr:YcxB family protein [Oligoflexia bacterium]